MIRTVNFSNKFIYNVASLIEDKGQFYEELYKIILLKIENIKIFPRMYPLFQNTKYRKFSVKNYIILYTIKDNSINVYNIFPTKSNYQTRFH